MKIPKVNLKSRAFWAALLGAATGVAAGEYGVVEAVKRVLDALAVQ